MSIEEFLIPPGEVARVRIIDSTSSISGLPVSYLMQPPQWTGFDHDEEPANLGLPDREAVRPKGTLRSWDPEGLEESRAGCGRVGWKSAGWDVRAEKNVVCYPGRTWCWGGGDWECDLEVHYSDPPFTLRFDPPCEILADDVLFPS